MSSNASELPLPYGWIKQIHAQSGQPFYVCPNSIQLVLITQAAFQG